NLKQQTLDFFDIKKEITVIPNFIDLNRFVNKKREHFRKAIAPDDERILIHTSNFRKVKNTSDVIRIFHQVNQKLPSKLLMVGDGPERSNAEELSRQLDIAHNVRFLGKQDAIEEMMSVSDLCLMPTSSEGFGLAALDAMACSVPVVSSNARGIPALNVQAATGSLDDISDLVSMAKHARPIL